MYILIFAFSSVASAVYTFNDREDWYNDAFKEKYLKEVQSETLPVNDYVLNKDGTITALIHQSQIANGVSNISNIGVSETSKPYVTAKWVEGLERCKIKAGYYDVKFFIPAENK
ncbi:hypothetical protein D3C71_1807190 [compost metagenome]